MAPSEFQVAIDSYLADCRRRGLRPATVRYYDFALGRVAKCSGITTPGDLTISAARGYQDSEAGLSPASLRGVLRALKTFTGWLTDEGLVAADPLSRLRLPRVDEAVVIAPCDAELIELLWAAGPTLRMVLLVLMGTGIRISDLSLLERSGLRPGDLVVPTTKNRAGRPLDPVLEAMLRRHVASNVRRGEVPLFESRSGRRLTPDAVRLSLADALARARLEVRVSPHKVRHWYARDLAANGTTDRLLAARMGWRSRGLIGRYAPVAAHELRNDIERYAPLVRLRDEGLLAGLLPPSVLDGEAYRSKKDSARDGSSTVRPGRARHS